MVEDHSDSERGNSLLPHGLAARVLLYASSHRQDNNNDCNKQPSLLYKCNPKADTEHITYWLNTWHPVSSGARCSSVVRAHGVMGCRINPSWWTHRAISHSSQCSTTG